MNFKENRIVNSLHESELASKISESDFTQDMAPSQIDQLINDAKEIRRVLHLRNINKRKILDMYDKKIIVDIPIGSEETLIKELEDFNNNFYGEDDLVFAKAFDNNSNDDIIFNDSNFELDEFINNVSLKENFKNDDIDGVNINSINNTNASASDISTKGLDDYQSKLNIYENKLNNQNKNISSLSDNELNRNFKNINSNNSYFEKTNNEIISNSTNNKKISLSDVSTKEIDDYENKLRNQIINDFENDKDSSQTHAENIEHNKNNFELNKKQKKQQWKKILRDKKQKIKKSFLNDKNNNIDFDNTEFEVIENVSQRKKSLDNEIDYNNSFTLPFDVIESIEKYDKKHGNDFPINEDTIADVTKIINDDNKSIVVTKEEEKNKILDYVEKEIDNGEFSLIKFDRPLSISGKRIHKKIKSLRQHFIDTYGSELFKQVSDWIVEEQNLYNNLDHIERINKYKQNKLKLAKQMQIRERLRRFFRG